MRTVLIPIAIACLSTVSHAAPNQTIKGRLRGMVMKGYDPLLSAPPSSKLNDGSWTAEKEYGAVIYSKGESPLKSIKGLEIESTEISARTKDKNPKAETAELDLHANPQKLSDIPADPSPPEPESLPLLPGDALKDAVSDQVTFKGPDHISPDLSLKVNQKGTPETFPPLPIGSTKNIAPETSTKRTDANLTLATAKAVESRGPQEFLPALPAGADTDNFNQSDELFEKGNISVEASGIGDLINLLKNSNPKIRARAADELGRRGNQSIPAIEALKRALSDPYSYVRASAILALGNIGADATNLRPMLKPFLNDKNPDVHLSAQTAMSRLK